MCLAVGKFYYSFGSYSSMLRKQVCWELSCLRQRKSPYHLYAMLHFILFWGYRTCYLKLTLPVNAIQLCGVFRTYGAINDGPNIKAYSIGGLGVFVFPSLLGLTVKIFLKLSLPLSICHCGCSFISQLFVRAKSIRWWSS